MAERQPSVAVTARLSRKEVESLDRLAKSRRRTRSQLVREAVAAYVGESAEYDLALERFRDPQDKVLSGDELWASLGWS
ncbi:MAG: ribbon-helix-helix protein, CopG family [Acidobacteriota bacterium]